MKTNKYLLKISVFLLCVLFLTVSAEAQRRRKPTTTTTTTTTAATAAEIKEGAGKVSIQLKNVSKFIYNLAIIGRSIEDLDVEIKAGKASQKGIETNTKNKQAVLAGLRNLRAGLAALEVEFRTKPALKTYNLQIQGIADLCGQAEDLAAAGQFLESGKPLLLAIEKLSDTLVAMP